MLKGNEEKIKIMIILLSIAPILGCVGGQKGASERAVCEHYISLKDPYSTFTVNESGSYYCLNKSAEKIINPAIRFKEGIHNTVLDCRGHKLSGREARRVQTFDGVKLMSRSQNNTVKNCKITEFDDAIQLKNTSNNRIVNNTLVSNVAGIQLEFSEGNLIERNRMNKNQYGIYLLKSSNNLIEDNKANSNDKGIELRYSSNNFITRNIFRNSTRDDFYIKVSSDLHCNNKVKDNIGSGERRIKYYNYSVDLSGEIISELILCDADRSTLKNIKIKGSQEKKNNGLLVLRTENSNFTGIKSSNNSDGILFYKSSFNKLTDSEANSNDLTGIWLAGSSKNNSLVNNTASFNHLGVYLGKNSSNNTLLNNKANSNERYGILLPSTEENILVDNTANLNEGKDIMFYEAAL